MKQLKTNAIRILEQKKAAFQPHSYEPEEVPNGIEVAEALHLELPSVFKTLVTVGKSGANYVFVIPVACELDLKKAAEAAREKHISMVKSKDLLGLTGYVHGGCSPVGMKKQLPTFIDESAASLTAIVVSGGKVGTYLELSLSELAKALPFELASLV